VGLLTRIESRKREEIKGERRDELTENITFIIFFYKSQSVFRLGKEGNERDIIPHFCDHAGADPCSRANHNLFNIIRSLSKQPTGLKLSLSL